MKTAPGSDFNASFIFECKNRKNPASKDDVITLAQKVRAVGATRGFLVAKKFSKYARAQANPDSRVELIECTDEFISPAEFEVTHLVHEPIKITATLQPHEMTPSWGQNIRPEKQACRFRNNPVQFRSFGDSLLLQVLERYRAEKPDMYLNNRNHFARFSGRFEFEKGEFIIGDTEIAWLDLYSEFFVNFKRHVMVSKFELKGKGRVFSFEDPDPKRAESKMQIDIIQRI